MLPTVYTTTPELPAQGSTYETKFEDRGPQQMLRSYQMDRLENWCEMN